MNTTLHSIYGVVFGNVFSVPLNSTISDQKMQFPESSQNCISKKFGFWSIWGLLSQRVKIVQCGVV